jgi:hypothetical protein
LEYLWHSIRGRNAKSLTAQANFAQRQFASPDNTAGKAISVKKNPVLYHSPYSPDLALNNAFTLQKIKCSIKSLFLNILKISKAL